MVSARCFFELKRRGLFGIERTVTYTDYHDDEYEDDGEQKAEDEDLFSQIEDLSEFIRDYEEKWVSRFSDQFVHRGFITARQRQILMDILSKLEDRS